MPTSPVPMKGTALGLRREPVRWAAGPTTLAPRAKVAASRFPAAVEELAGDSSGGGPRC
jgi:hypothetical protein